MPCHATLSCAVPLQTDAVSEAKLKAAAGLAQLDGRRYKAAARAFVGVSPELGANYSDVSTEQQWSSCHDWAVVQSIATFWTAAMAPCSAL